MDEEYCGKDEFAPERLDEEFEVEVANERLAKYHQLGLVASHAHGGQVGLVEDVAVVSFALLGGRNAAFVELIALALEFGIGSDWVCWHFNGDDVLASKLRERLVQEILCWSK